MNTAPPGELLDQLPCLTLITDRAGRVLEVNAEMATLLGKPKSHWTGRSMDELFPPATRIFLQTHVWPMLLRDGDVRELFLHLRDGQAQRIPVMLNCRTVRLGARAAYCWLFFVAFERSRYEAKLLGARKHAEDGLRIAATAFESHDGMFITDAEQVIVRVNAAFTEITGYAAAAAVGHSVKLLDDAQQPSFSAALIACAKEQERWHGELSSRRQNGESYPLSVTISLVRNERAEISHYVATMTDISFRRIAEEEIFNLAFYDALTGLPNRRLLLDRLHQALTASQRSRSYGALLFIDLDRFKRLNDGLGHGHGDLLLQQAAQRLQGCVRESDSVARLSGDEFAVMMEGLGENADEAAIAARRVGEKCLQQLDHRYQVDGHQHHSTSSIGITLFLAKQWSIDELLMRADLAIFQAKAAGGNTLCFFERGMQAAAAIRTQLEADLRQALIDSQFALYYQGQFDHRARLIGVEALLRWPHPQRGMVPPGDFIPFAEESELILPIGYWVLRSACAQLAAWARQPELGRLSVAVNISASQLHQADFVAQVLAVLESTGANPQRLKLELTESLLVDDVENIIAKMNALKARGITFALDDFGTGYSSLAYLKRLPLAHLKIDQSFVRDILTDANDAAIAKMIIALGDSLGLDIIAEGVELSAQRELLEQMGCRTYQGYLYSRPLPLDEFEAFAKHRERCAPATGSPYLR